MNTEGKEEDAQSGGNLVIKKPWPGLMKEVHNNPEKFKSYFSKFKDCYLSGDGARIDDEGNFWILGRMDDAINVSGHRISTAEIESVLVSHPAVGEAGVVPIPHEIKGEAIYAYVALRDNIEWTEDLRKELRSHVRSKIGALASPEQIQFVEELPKTLSGKILRRLLRKIAAGEGLENLGDITTLARPDVLPTIVTGRDRLFAGQPEHSHD